MLAGTPGEGGAFAWRYQLDQCIHMAHFFYLLYARDGARMLWCTINLFSLHITCSSLLSPFLYIHLQLSINLVYIPTHTVAL